MCLIFCPIIFWLLTCICCFLRNVGGGSPEGDGSPNESDRKRSKCQYRSKTYKVAISYAAKIPLQAISNTLNGKETEHFQEAVRVLDVILRQHAAKQ